MSHRKKYLLQKSFYSNIISRILPDTHTRTHGRPTALPGPTSDR